MVKQANSFLSIIKMIFYIKEEYNISHGLGVYLANELRKSCISSYSDFRLLITYDTKSINLYKLRLCPINPNYNRLIKKAEADKKQQVGLYATCIKFIPNGKTIDVNNIIPNKMFPSDNFINLAKLIDRNIFTSTKLGYYKPVSILINGEPGLGKTTSGDYIAHNTEIKTIRKIDLTNYINSEVPIELIFNSIIPNPLTNHTVIIIDELDKYMNVKCKSHEDAEKLNQEILNHILSLIEQECSDAYCLFILFCCNNFSTMFDFISPDDRVHYKSFESRFLKLEFKKIGKNELCRYFNWLSNQLEEGDLSKYDFSQIPDDFTITFRDLIQYASTNLYDIDYICKNIASYTKPQQLIESSSYRVIEKKNKPEKGEPEKNKEETKYSGNGIFSTPIEEDNDIIWKKWVPIDLVKTPLLTNNGKGFIVLT